jgi:SulP family sulfate permease
VLFFGAASKIDPLAQAIEAAPQGVQVHLDIHDLFALDTTGLEGLEQILKAVAERGGRLTLSGAQAQPASLMERSGFNVRLAAQSAAPQGPAAASAPGHGPSSGETPG